MNFHVYKITNIKNKKIYVGKTSGDYRVRWKRHQKIAQGKRSYGKYCNKYPIHYAINKYGVDSFDFCVLKSFFDEKKSLCL